MNPPPHSFARRGNSGSRCWNVNSAIAGTFERYAITVAPSGDRSPVEMSSGATIRTRSSSESGSSFCSGGGLMFGPRGISIDPGLVGRNRLEDVRLDDRRSRGRSRGQVWRGQLSRVGDLALQHRRGRNRRGAQVDAVVGRSAAAREVPVERPQRVRSRGRRLAHADARPAGRLEHPDARRQQLDVRARLRDLVEDLPRARASRSPRSASRRAGCRGAPRRRWPCPRRTS